MNVYQDMFVSFLKISYIIYIQGVTEIQIQNLTMYIKTQNMTFFLRMPKSI